MTIKKIVDYVIYTPYNTNKAILTLMLKDLILSHGGSLEGDGSGSGPGPDEENKDIIYDGGIES